MHNVKPKYVKNIESKIESKLKLIRQPNTDVLDIKQLYFDGILEVNY